MSLPIVEHLPAILQSLAISHQAIVEAEPGAGKTTLLPPALLNEPWCVGQVLVSQPRRIAARMAASRVAQEQAQRLGDTTGYQVRFDDKTTTKTRLIYLTEGILLARLFSGDDLPGVSAVVLDEVHERSADLDVLVALLLRLQKARPTLKLIFMSATLNAKELHRYLPHASFHQSKGRSFGVALHHHERPDDRPLPIQVRSALRTALETPGDVLVFLPGAAEIRACERACEQLSGIELSSLHGSLSFEEQQRAMQRGGDKRKVILSTNIAESSVTIPAITSVVDSGLARTKIFDAFSGVARLETGKISQARCEQRAGRAGRVRDGHVFRLYTKGDLQARPAHEQPELLGEDLSGIYLRLLRSSVLPSGLSWITTPSHKSWNNAHELLTQLGALQPGKDSTTLTEIGAAMAQLPLPPRLARLALEAWIQGEERQGNATAALLSERDILLQSRGHNSHFPPDIAVGDCDIQDRIELLDQLREARFNARMARDLGIDLRAAKQVDQIARSLLPLVKKASRRLTRVTRSPPRNVTTSLKGALLAGFPDRVATRRANSRQVLLSNGVTAVLHESSSVLNAPLILAVSADAPGGRNRSTTIRLATQISANWLMEVANASIVASESFQWNMDKNRVDEVSQLSYGKVVLDETRTEATPCPESAKVLMKEALTKGPAVYDPMGRLSEFFVKLQLLREHLPEAFPDPSKEETTPQTKVQTGASGEDSTLNRYPPSQLSEEELDESPWIQAALQQAALCTSSLNKLATMNLAEQLFTALPQQTQESIRTELPLSITLRGGRSLIVHYEQGRTPWVESRLQDFFSMTDTPALFRGRLAIQLHLLAPNKRAVQVTTDLAGFWTRHYPTLRKQLMRRYPRHLWPKDGSDAKPPTPGRIR